MTPPHSLGGAQRLLAAILLQAPRLMAAERDATRLDAYGELLTRVGGLWPPVVGVGIYSSEDEDGDQREGVVLLSEEDAPELSDFLSREFSLFAFRLRLVVSGPLLAASRPAQGGDSLSHGSVGGITGTFGCLVQDPAGNPYLLSCNHVIAACNGAQVGDEVWQPGAKDGGSGVTRIGTLYGFKPLQLGGIVPNDIDAAIAIPYAKVDVRSGVRGFGPIDGWRASIPLQSPVQKVGWKTTHTHGKLLFNQLSAVLKMDRQNREALFDDLQAITSISDDPFAKDGDSGAIVLDEEHLAVGLVIGVAGGMDLGLATPIKSVLSHFAVEPVTS